MMKPKRPAGLAAGGGEDGLLEYLEDIIGTNQLVERIDAAEKVVEAMTAERGDKLTRVKIVEKERAALESAKMEAEALLRAWRARAPRGRGGAAPQPPPPAYRHNPLSHTAQARSASSRARRAWSRRRR